MKAVKDPIRTYAGDGHDFDEPGSYRTEQVVIVDTVHNTVVSAQSDTGISRAFDGSGNITSTAQADPKQGFSATGPVFRDDGAAEFRIAGHSTNPLAILGGINYAPGIDYTITVVRATDEWITIQVSHDGFPAHELSVNGQPVYRFDPRVANTTPARLIPMTPDVHSPTIALPSPHFTQPVQSRPAAQQSW